MHIVFVSREFIPSPRKGGIGSCVNETAFALAAAGEKVTVICASNDTRKKEDKTIRGVRVILLDGGDFYIPGEEGRNFMSLRLLKKLRSLYRFFSYRRKIREEILRLKDVDIIEVPEFGAEGYYLTDLHIPVVFRLYTPSFHDRNTLKLRKFKPATFHIYFIQKMEYNLLKKARHIISCSEDLKKWFSDVFGNILPEIKVIYSLFDTASWTDRGKVPENRRAGSVPQIFFAGTVCKEKGVEDLIAACEMLRERYGIDTELILAGKFARGFKKPSQQRVWCKFLGQISKDELVAYYRNADITCFPSWWDNMPMVCLEAMFFKALVMGSASGGMAEMINNGTDGFLVPPKNPEILAEKIADILSLPCEKKAGIRENARRAVLSRFSADVIIPQMIAYYRQIIEKS
jgi:glycosyltransferase involved in cell wall biosynthesis